MNIQQKREEWFALFRKGEKKIFIITDQKANTETLKFEDMVFRKLNDKNISISGWISKSEAEDYLQKNLKKESYHITEITGENFRAFLNTINPALRKMIVLDLI